METELNCGKRRRRSESARRTGSLTFLRIRVSDEDVVTIPVHLATCWRIFPNSTAIQLTPTAVSTFTFRRNSAASSGITVLMNMPEPSSNPAVRVSRGITLMYQWK